MGIAEAIKDVTRLNTVLVSGFTPVGEPTLLVPKYPSICRIYHDFLQAARRTKALWK